MMGIMEIMAFLAASGFTEIVIKIVNAGIAEDIVNARIAEDIVKIWNAGNVIEIVKIGNVEIISNSQILDMYGKIWEEQGGSQLPVPLQKLQHILCFHQDALNL